MGCGLGGLSLTLGRTFLLRWSSAALEQVSLVWKNGNFTQLLKHSHCSLTLVLTTVT